MRIVKWSTFFLCLIVIVALFAPALTVSEARRRNLKVAVLVDRSMSTDYRNLDKSSPRNRIDAYIKEKIFRRNGQAIEFDWFIFGRNLAQSSNGEIFTKAQPVDNQYTDIDGVFVELDRRNKRVKEKYDASIVLSDGFNTTPIENCRFGDTGSLGLIQFVLFSNKVKDINIKQIRYPSMSFLRIPLKIEVQVELREIAAGTAVPVFFKQNGQILASNTIVSDGSLMKRSIEFEYLPQEPGVHHFSVELQHLADEAIENNNSRDFFIRVAQDKTRILHVCGAPSWDQRFFREVLTGATSINLISFYILRSPIGNDPEARDDELSLIQFPHIKLFTTELKSFDLVIFQNFDYYKYQVTQHHLTNIAKYVQDGGSFLFIGGDLSFNEGGYLETSLADILPLELCRLPTSFRSFNSKVHLTATGENHPIMRLFPDRSQNVDEWAGLPPISAINNMCGLKPDSNVLLESDLSERPVVAIRKIGKGLSAAIPTDSTWQWSFRQGMDKGTNRTYHEFYLKLLGFLTKSLDYKPFKIETNKLEYKPFEQVVITIKARYWDFRPYLEPIQIKIDVGDQVKMEKVVSGDADGEYRLDYRPTEEGMHRLIGNIRIDGKNMEESGVFLVDDRSPELSVLDIDSDFLDRLKKRTDVLIVEEDQDFLLPELKGPNAYESLSSRITPLWDNGYVLALIFLLLCSAWIARKIIGVE